jgi:hypothetical protein
MAASFLAKRVLKKVGRENPRQGIDVLDAKAVLQTRWPHLVSTE